jgi:hypothetical protein
VLLIAVAVAVTLAPTVSAGAATSYEAAHYPKAAATFVAKHLARQRLYAPDGWGGYLAYRFPDGRVVFLYDETAVFGDTALQRYLDIHLLRSDWTRILHDERIRVAIVGAAAQEAAAFHEVGWTVRCHDAASQSLVMSAPTAVPAHVAAPLRNPLDTSPAC